MRRSRDDVSIWVGVKKRKALGFSNKVSYWLSLFKRVLTVGSIHFRRPSTHSIPDCGFRLPLIFFSPMNH